MQSESLADFKSFYSSSMQVSTSPRSESDDSKFTFPNIFTLHGFVFAAVPVSNLRAVCVIVQTPDVNELFFNGLCIS